MKATLLGLAPILLAALGASPPTTPLWVEGAPAPMQAALTTELEGEARLVATATAAEVRARLRAGRHLEVRGPRGRLLVERSVARAGPGADRVFVALIAQAVRAHRAAPGPGTATRTSGGGDVTRGGGGRAPAALGVDAPGRAETATLATGRPADDEPPRGPTAGAKTPGVEAARDSKTRETPAPVGPPDATAPSGPDVSDGDAPTARPTPTDDDEPRTPRTGPAGEGRAEPAGASTSSGSRGPAPTLTLSATAMARLWTTPAAARLGGALASHYHLGRWRFGARIVGAGGPTLRTADIEADLGALDAYGELGVRAATVGPVDLVARLGAGVGLLFGSAKAREPTFADPGTPSRLTLAEPLVCPALAFEWAASPRWTLSGAAFARVSLRTHAVDLPDTFAAQTEAPLRTARVQPGLALGLRWTAIAAEKE